jgi:hypothetical protein
MQTQMSSEVSARAASASAWNELHPNPRISYYLLLRANYDLSAQEAHGKVKRMDAMVIGLHGERRKNGETWREKVSRTGYLIRKCFGHAAAQPEEP